MCTRYCGLLLVVFITLFQDMGNSSPIHTTPSIICTWNFFQQQTRDLNNRAQHLYNITNPMKDVALDEIPRFQCLHHCGPQHLTSNKTTCLKRVVHILSYYHKVLTKLNMEKLNMAKLNMTGQEELLKKYVDEIKKNILDLLHCLKFMGYEDTDETPLSETTDEFVIKTIGFPLVSATSLIARVFSPGNPTDHTVAKRH